MAMASKGAGRVVQGPTFLVTCDSPEAGARQAGASDYRQRLGREVISQLLTCEAELLDVVGLLEDSNNLLTE